MLAIAAIWKKNFSKSLTVTGSFLALIVHLMVDLYGLFSVENVTIWELTLGVCLLVISIPAIFSSFFDEPHLDILSFSKLFTAMVVFFLMISFLHFTKPLPNLYVYFFPPSELCNINETCSGWIYAGRFDDQSYPPKKIASYTPELMPDLNADRVQSFCPVVGSLDATRNLKSEQKVIALWVNAEGYPLEMSNPPTRYIQPKTGAVTVEVDTTEPAPLSCKFLRQPGCIEEISVTLPANTRVRVIGCSKFVVGRNSYPDFWLKIRDYTYKRNPL